MSSLADAALSNAKRCMKMLCKLVGGKAGLMLNGKRIVLRIDESNCNFFGTCETNEDDIVVTLTPLAFTNDFILKRTICHEFVHCLFAAFDGNTDEIKKHLLNLVTKAVNYLFGEDPYDAEFSGDEYMCSEEQFCFFLEGVLSLLLYVAPEWDVIRDEEHRLYNEKINNSEVSC